MNYGIDEKAVDPVSLRFSNMVGYDLSMRCFLLTVGIKRVAGLRARIFRRKIRRSKLATPLG